MNKKRIAGIVLAAGQGKRMNSSVQNKVTLPLAGKPMIVRTVELLRSTDIRPIIIVVGFAQESVEKLFEGEDVIFAEQKERLGTAHAVQTAIAKLPKDISNVLILQGDDSAFYSKKNLEGLISEHLNSQAAFTFMTIEVDDPTGLGRIVRDMGGKLVGIVEEKDASEEQREISEINPACYVANVDFLMKYLPDIEPSPVTGEYYLTSLIDIGIKNNEKVWAFAAGKIPWRGVNTGEELKEAEELFSQVNKSMQPAEVDINSSPKL